MRPPSYEGGYAPLGAPPEYEGGYAPTADPECTLPAVFTVTAPGAARSVGASVDVPRSTVITVGIGETLVQFGLTPVVAVIPALALAAASPLVEISHHPNAQTVHLLYHVDFRPDHNPYLPYMEKIPLSPFWPRRFAQ